MRANRFARSFFVLALGTLLGACGSSPSAPSDPPSGSVEVVNPDPSNPTEYYDSSPGYVTITPAQGNQYRVNVPAGMVRVIPRKFVPGRHQPLPTGSGDTIEYDSDVWLSPDMPFSPDTKEYRIQWVTADDAGNGTSPGGMSGSCTLVPGQAVGCNSMTRTSPGLYVAKMVYTLYINLFSQSAGIPPISVPVDWGTR